MVALTSLIVPIVVAAVVVFIASSIFHMVLPFHRHDLSPVPDQDETQSALRPLNLRPGNYMVPSPAKPADMKDPVFVERRRKGPVALITVMPSGDVAMGKNLAQWFVYLLVVSFFAAYVVSRALPPGAAYPEAFRFAGSTAFAAYALSLPQMSIWWGRNWRATIVSMIDGLVYALLTGGVFGWLWPNP